MSLMCLDHLGLTVSDVDRSTRWYCDHLGFEPVIRYARADIGADVQVLRHTGAGMRLSLRRFEDGDTGPFDELRIGLDHVAFQVEDEADLERWRRRLEAAGVQCDRSQQPELTILVCRDPDNIQIELCTPLRG